MSLALNQKLEMTRLRGQTWKTGTAKSQASRAKVSKETFSKEMKSATQVDAWIRTSGHLFADMRNVSVVWIEKPRQP